MSQWIAGITRGHNAGVCLLKDGEVVFAIEEERLTRVKYDGGPLLSLLKIKEYTDKLDYLVIAHTQLINQSGQLGTLDYSGEDPYTGLARKLGLIGIHTGQDTPHPQVIDLGNVHHKLHAACAFYRSGFSDAVSLVVDGAGTFIDHNSNGRQTMLWETESIFDCSYPDGISARYKHLGGNNFRSLLIETQFDNQLLDPDDQGQSILIADATAGIVKTYEAVTQYNGFQAYRSR